MFDNKMPRVDSRPGRSRGPLGRAPGLRGDVGDETEGTRVSVLGGDGVEGTAEAGR